MMTTDISCSVADIQLDSVGEHDLPVSNARSPTCSLLKDGGEEIHRMMLLHD
jgi:hypothetical protein